MEVVKCLAASYRIPQCGDKACLAALRLESRKNVNICSEMLLSHVKGGIQEGDGLALKRPGLSGPSGRRDSPLRRNAV